ncbi:MAG: hypothetical protein ACQEQC_07215 [Elusimicrobiota bacterium]
MKKLTFLIVTISLLFLKPAIASNYVLNIDGARVTVDKGTRDGIKEGNSVKVYRINKTTHPKTGRKIESRVLIERHARVLSADKDTSVILLPDSQISTGMTIELEQKKTFTGSDNNLNALIMQGEYISFSGENTIKSGRVGYRYFFDAAGIEMGGGGIENNIKNETEQYYYGYLGPGISIESFSMTASLLAGVDGDGTEFGYGANMQFSDANTPTLVALYNYYPPLGSYASFEIGVPVSNTFKTILKTSWTDINENNGAIVFKGGLGLSTGNIDIKPLVGVGVEDSDKIGLAADLTVGFPF